MSGNFEQYGSVFRVIEIVDDKVTWRSHPYDTVGAARNRASKQNNEEQRFARLYREGNVRKRYEVQALEGTWAATE